MRPPLPEHIRNIERPLNEEIHIRGPGNSAFLIEMMPSRDVFEIRFLLKNFILGKHQCTYEKSGVSQFDRLGYVLTKPLSDFNLAAKRASVHSRQIGVDSVIEMKKAKKLKFVCDPSRIYVTAQKLVDSGYEVESSGVSYFPKQLIDLKKSHRILCEKFLGVMSQLPNVISIHDNIKREPV